MPWNSRNEGLKRGGWRGRQLITTIWPLGVLAGVRVGVPVEVGVGVVSASASGSPTEAPSAVPAPAVGVAQLGGRVREAGAPLQHYSHVIPTLITKKGGTNVYHAKTHHQKVFSSRDEGEMMVSNAVDDVDVAALP